MSELDHKESWALKNCCFWSVVLEKIHESALDSMEIKLVNPKGNQSWIFIGMTDSEAPKLWLPEWRTDSLEKTLMLGKIVDRGKGGNRGWDGWMATPAQYTWVWSSSGSWWWTGKPGVSGVAKSQTQLSNWTENLKMQGNVPPSLITSIRKENDFFF